MIKSTELRIGNIIERHYTYPATPARNHIDRVVVSEVSELWLIDSCGEAMPIPLTPEILEKCGAKISQIHNNFNNRYLFTSDEDSNFVRFEEDAPEYYIELFAGGHEGACSATVKYLHQLQNLYYALTGNELEVKL